MECKEDTRWERVKHAAAENLPLIAGVAMIFHASVHILPFIYVARGYVDGAGPLYNILEPIAHVMEHPIFLFGIGGLLILDYVMHRRQHKAYHALEHENDELRKQLAKPKKK